ncbi:MAG: hypothetical protein ACYDAJ_11460 [Nitrosotalea sp.]
MNSSSISIILILLASLFINTNIVLAQNETGLAYNSSHYVNPSLISPLKQFESGIKSESVKCVTNFQLLVKENNGQPACVKISSLSRLVSQGWILPHVLQVENSKFSISYGILGGTLENATYDSTTNSIDLSVNTSDKGFFNIQLSRLLIDSKDKSGKDEIWSVLLDGKETGYGETKANSYRIISFPFEYGLQKVVIIPYCSSFPC